MVWTVIERAPGQVVTTPAATQPVFIPVTKMGAPGGVATLDERKKISRDQIQMAVETEAALNALNETIENLVVEGVAPESGDGIKVVGEVVNIDINGLTLAP